MQYQDIEQFHNCQPERLLTREEAARILGLQPCTLAKWACRRKHGLPVIRVGSRVRYRLQDVYEFIERNTAC